MPDSNYPLYISIVGMTISLISLAITLTKFRKEIKGRLKMLHQFLEDNSGLDIILMNTSFRALTLISYEILYASSDYYYQSIATVDIDSRPKLADSETFKFYIDRKELQELAKKNGIKQGYYHILKIRVRTSNSGTFIFDLDIPKKIIQGDYYELAERFIAADIFLGFPKAESKYYPTGKSMIGSHK